MPTRSTSGLSCVSPTTAAAAAPRSLLDLPPGPSSPSSSFSLVTAPSSFARPSSSSSSSCAPASAAADSAAGSASPAARGVDGRNRTCPILSAPCPPLREPAQSPSPACTTSPSSLGPAPSSSLTSSPHAAHPVAHSTMSSKAGGLRGSLSVPCGLHDLAAASSSPRSLSPTPSSNPDAASVLAAPASLLGVSSPSSSKSTTLSSSPSHLALISTAGGQSKKRQQRDYSSEDEAMLSYAPMKASRHDRCGQLLKIGPDLATIERRRCRAPVSEDRWREILRVAGGSPSSTSSSHTSSSSDEERTTACTQGAAHACPGRALSPSSPSSSSSSMVFAPPAGHKPLPRIEELSVPPVPPAELLERILVLHKYDIHPIQANLSDYYHSKPTPEQVEAYDMNLVAAVRNCDVGRVKQISDSGRPVNACNRFGESVMHMACRRSAIDILQFLIDSGLGVNRSDDLGRTPLHDACWAASPNIEIVRLLLDTNRYLVYVADNRRTLPLTYIHQDHWAAWCAFLLVQKDAWWHPAMAEDWNRHLKENRGSALAGAEPASGQSK